MVWFYRDIKKCRLVQNHRDDLADEAGGAIIGAYPTSLLMLMRELRHSCCRFLAVGTSILLMTITDTEHAPAASTALGVAVEGFSYELLVFIVVATTLLSLFQRAIIKHIENLV
ncbi:MAG: HPP family protein [Thermoplasmata archaeon]|nr:HPP family protein [Thermoplasmata archaeon]